MIISFDKNERILKNIYPVSSLYVYNDLDYCINAKKKPFEYFNVLKVGKRKIYRI